MRDLGAVLTGVDRGYRRLLADHATALDAAIGLLVGLVALGEGLARARSERDFTWTAALPLGVAVACRRRWPLGSYLVLFAFVAAWAAAMPVGCFVAVLLAGYSLAAYGRSQPLSFLVLLGSAVFVSLAFHSDLSFLPQSSVSFIILGTLWLAGAATRSRQRAADLSEERALRLEREQAQAGQIALAQERSRIARELHDVVTHSVSVMVVQAGAARHVISSSPDRAEVALLAVEARGREALAELRGFLGVLEGGFESDPELLPQPGTDNLAALVEGVTAAGLPVTLAVVGEPRPLSRGVALATYRVVQEGLTNALRYAEGADTEVVVSYRPGEVCVEVLDQGPGRAEAPEGGGRGLSGLRERLVVYGGRLEAGRRPSGGFAVRASIPT